MTYREEIRHMGLNKYRVVTGQSWEEVNNRIAVQRAQWNAQYLRKVQTERGLGSAQSRTESAERVQRALDNILFDSLNQPELTFDGLMQRDPYGVPMPVKGRAKSYAPAPSRDSDTYNPPMPFLMKYLGVGRAEYDRENQERFDTDYAEWERECQEVGAYNERIRQAFIQELEVWEEGRKAYEEKLAESNRIVAASKARFQSGDIDTIKEFMELAIEAISLPIDFTLEAQSEYQAKERTLILDVLFPTVDCIPTLKNVTYVKSRNALKETHYSDAYQRRKYESVIYQLVLRVIKCVFTVDEKPNILDTVVLNGYVNTVDRTNGQPISPYILSLNVSKQEYRSLNLAGIDPRAWFKSAKGVSAAKLANVTPVAPIIQMNREDSRFVDGYSVESSLDEGVNLAAMDWQDFENLVRELFEEEFNVPGGEVRITQASRDGGVDAVVFDPDPIRGGKIVIQAKRYTNTVGVSAVRDLYGTVVNEGAMKGILVTTANYGNDAYIFAKDKPLTLLNGANLLSLLEKHGHKARIDLKEAKELYRQGE